MQLNKNEIKKILIIKPRGIGDIIHSTIVLENLKDYFPSAQIHYLTEEFAKRVVENNPFVNKVITFLRKEFLLKIVLKIRKEKYDLIFDFWSNPKTAQITFLAGVKYRAGYSKIGRRYAYNIKTISNNPDLHAAENHLVLLEYMQIPIISKKILFYLSEDEKSFAKNFIRKYFNDEIIVGIIPAGGWESKRCEPEKWVEICNSIRAGIEPGNKVKFIVLWGPGDEQDANSIKNSLGENAVLIPKTTLGELAGLINECNLAIANDSGPMHIAAALGIPVIGLYGPTNPEAHRPYSNNSDYVVKKNLHCINCNRLICPYNHECMKELSVNEIIRKSNALLSKKIK